MVILGVNYGAGAGKQVLLYKIVSHPDALWPPGHSTAQNKLWLTAVPGMAHGVEGSLWNCMRQVSGYGSLLLTTADPACLESSAEERNCREGREGIGDPFKCLCYRHFRRTRTKDLIGVRPNVRKIY